jgi:hypothetical protein
LVLGALAIAGCSAASAAQRDTSIANAAGGLIYVADATNSVIHIYPLRGINQTQIGLITGVPVVESLGVDRWHNLYVVEFGAGKVLVYPKGATSPSLTLNVAPAGANPNRVAISHAGEVAVGQFQTNGIDFYRKGASAPYKRVRPPAGYAAGFCAYDASGNLYVILSAPDGPSHIGEVVGGGSGSRIEDLGANTGITTAKGIEVDTRGDVGVLGDAATLNVYAPGTNELLSSATLLAPPNPGPNPSGGFSLIPSGDALYVASAIPDGTSAQAYRYAYPGGGRSTNTIAVQPPSENGQASATSVAIDPPAAR